MKQVNMLFKNSSYFTKEAYKTLRTNISFCGSDNKVICITSCEQNEGKSTISLELARHLCEINLRVLVIDADLRKSVMLSKNTNESGLVGLSQYLANHIELDEAINKTQLPNLDIIFAGHYPPNPTELLDNQRFKDLIKQVREQYDYVIIDTPPLGLVIDAAIVCKSCDAAILVIAKNVVRMSRAAEIKEQILKSGCKILGLILNDTTKPSKISGQYGKYYKYGKYSKYSKYAKYAKYGKYEKYEKA